MLYLVQLNFIVFASAPEAPVLPVIGLNVKAPTALESVKSICVESIDEDESLLIDPCNSIHTCFMNFSIDVLFLSKDNTIVHIVREMKPWRFSSIYLKSKRVLELKSGNIGSELKAGDQLEFKHV